jgi:epoxyqueuosine reductase
LGFDAVGICKTEPLVEDTAYLKDWLNAGQQAGMHYMENYFGKRIDPSKLVEGTKSVIVVLLNYTTDVYPFEKSKYKIARYALGNLQGQAFSTIAKNP